MTARPTRTSRVSPGAPGFGAPAARRGPRRGYGFELLLILPALALVAGVILYPIVHAVDASLHETRFLTRLGFIGLANYEAFLAGRNAGQIVTNSFVLVAGSLALTVPLGLGLALLVNMRLRLRLLFRTLLVLPWIISQVISAMLWSWLLNAQYGLARVVAEVLGAATFDVFGSRNTAMAGLILVNVWRTFPFAMLLMLAALQTVPRDLTEAAMLDTHSPWRRFWHITFPLIRPTILVVIIMLSLSYFNNIDLPLILTGGGPLDATNTLALAAYQQAFVFNRLGQGSALAVAVFAINIVLSLFYLRLLRSERHV